MLTSPKFLAALGGVSRSRRVVRGLRPLFTGIVLLTTCCLLALGCQPKEVPPPEFAPLTIPQQKKFTPDELLALSRPHGVQITSDSRVGSGFFVGKDLIMTCLHTVKGSENADVTTRDYISYEGAAIGVLAWSERHNWAILRVSPPRYMPGLALAGKPPNEGSRVGVVLLPPLGEKTKVYEMIVSYPTEAASLMQLNQPITRGSSGGPVLNDVGEVVGVVCDPTDLEEVRGGGQPLNTAVPAWAINAELQQSSLVNMFSFARATESDDDKFWRPILADWPELARRFALSLGVNVGAHYARLIRDEANAPDRNRKTYRDLLKSAYQAAEDRKHILDLAEALRAMPPDGPDLAKELIVSWENAAKENSEPSKQRLAQLTDEAVGYSRTYLEAGAIPVFPKRLGGLQFLSPAKNVDTSCRTLNSEQAPDGVSLVQCPYLDVSPSFVRGPVFLTYLNDRLVGVRADGADYTQAVRILSERYGLADFGVWQKGNWDFSSHAASYGPNTLYEWRMKGGRIRAGNQYGKTFVSYIHEEFQRATDDIY